MAFLLLSHDMFVTEMLNNTKPWKPTPKLWSQDQLRINVLHYWYNIAQVLYYIILYTKDIVA